MMRRLSWTGYIRELNELTGNKAENLTQGGTYTLNGVQACAYARIRMEAVMITAEQSVSVRF